MRLLICRLPALLLRFGAIISLIVPFFGSFAAVRINEFGAATSEWRLSRDAAGVAHVGSGLSWYDPSFNALSWTVCLLPAGYGFTGLATDLTSVMKDKTPSLYLRKEFQVTEDQAALTNSLILTVQYDDGFVAYLNGHEVARLNCGPTNHYVYVSEPAANVNTNTTLIDVPLGQVKSWLVAGRNVLAIQAHNAEQPSTTSDPGRITRHLPTLEFRINAGLRIAPPDTNSTPAYLILTGPGSGAWSYFVGRAEPSGGVVDMGLLTRTFVPPTGEEDDFDSPSAFSDWLELYNDGATGVSLSGWSLTDDVDDSGKWRFPTYATIPAYGCLLVLCDNRDEANPPVGPATYLHTNFRLNAAGGYLGFYDSTGAVVDSVAYPEQVHWCTYGRMPTNSLQFGFLSLATPGTTNDGPAFAGQAGGVEFTDSLGTNLLGGLYTNSSLQLFLRPRVPGETIRYTRDGSDPTEWLSILYSAPVVISQPYDRTGIVIRARSFLPGLIPSKITTHTYILRQPAALTNAAALCFTGDPKRAFYRPDGIMSIVGGTYPTNGNIIWLANGPQSYDWAVGDGTPFEREVHLEYFFQPGLYPTGQDPLRMDIGLRLSSSSYSRPRLKLTNPEGTSPWANNSAQKPSFNLFFDGEYGPGLLDYNLYTNYTTRQFEQLRLRAGKNDINNPFITDEFTRRLYIDMGYAGSKGLFCSVYFNGVYRGLFNLCERFREQFFQAHYRSTQDWDVNYIGTWVQGSSTVFDQLLAAVDLDLQTQSNWTTVTNLLDLDNAADYYLLNVYAAMWDWPQNNYVVARERSTGPLSRFRLGVWDAEGGFGAISSRATSYNSLTNDLLVPSTHANYSKPVPKIFRRLSTSAEFRLLFADHINARMFNGGVLDDQDPDGAGPLRPPIARRFDELVREAGELVKYSSGSALKQTAFNTWWGLTNSRRSYLLGSTAGRQQFRDSGFWPLTEPPVFSQFGGAVVPGFSLSITSYVATVGQSAVIFYTTNGADPRRYGGVVDPSVRVYTAPVPIPGLLTVKARARNTSTGEWSPITTATFAPESVPASSNNLVVAEIMYHPPKATAAEYALGYHDADDFEYARLQNIGATPVDLVGVRFYEGITFDFTASPVRYLAPGGNVLVVENLGAFQARYGHGCDSMIAGVYAGNLSNGGERLQLLDAGGAILRDFTYDDSEPWPEAADGDGPSLVLVNPGSNPDHSTATSWTVSALPGGSPSGSVIPQTYATWRALIWEASFATNNLVSGPEADPDGDGLGNFIEYAFGLDPTRSSAAPALETAVDTSEGEPRLAITIRFAAGAQNAIFTWEQSDDLVHWSSGAPALETVSSNISPSGVCTRKIREIDSLADRSARFLRLRITGP